MPLVSPHKLLVFQHLFTGHKGKKKKKKKLPKLSVVSVTQLYMLLCVMMIRGEGVFKKEKKNSWKSRCAVCCACVQGKERERGKRFKDREKMRCVIWDNRMIFKMYPWSYKLKKNIKREHILIAYGYVSRHTNMPKLSFMLQHSPEGHEWRRADPLYTNSVCVRLSTLVTSRKGTVLRA